MFGEIFILISSDSKLSGKRKLNPEISLAGFSVNFLTSKKRVRYKRNFRVMIIIIYVLKQELDSDILRTVQV